MSFGVQKALLRAFYDTVVTSALFYAVACWGGSSMDRDRKRLNKLVRRARVCKVVIKAKGNSKEYKT